MKKRNKYNYAFRLRCVEAVVKDNRSIKEVASQMGFNPSNLRLWVSFYRQYGSSGLISKGKRHYDTAFKQKVLQAIDNQFLSLRQACIRFNIRSESVIINWRRAFEMHGVAGLIAKSRGRPKKMKSPIKRKARKSSKPLTREEELLLENEYLKAENELLKKLQALAQPSKKQKP
ncbi:MAG TPA: helix-turn-helix domain-containing protein [Flavipsychrobacter sp.]|nr:helix-turn-helix domain-containing protein [Flavipsychrobacter sp.]